MNRKVSLSQSAQSLSDAWPSAFPANPIAWLADWRRSPLALLASR